MVLQQLGIAAKQAAFELSQSTSKQKDFALNTIADLLILNSDQILIANQKDVQLAKESGLSDAIIDRLLLTEERLKTIAKDVLNVMGLKDPIGEMIDGYTLKSGLRLQRKRVPIGVIGVIYEARPNVTIDIVSLCLKTGNAVILRGGKETINTNTVLIKIIQDALGRTDLPANAVQTITNPDRKFITQLLKLDRYVDMIIPRGGAALHQLCREQSTIPVITGGIGVCHIYIDETADFIKALPIIVNAKTQRPSTCNTLETLLVHRNIAKQFLPMLSQIMAENDVKLHANEEARAILDINGALVELVTDIELRQEWLSKDLNVIIVDTLTDAVEHIREYGSGHSESILTRNLINAEKFVNLVDAAAVYVNASTRFTDGAQFGLGAEVAVSTQKLHARGPMGLDALTTYKWIGYGDDLIRE
ncbi:glutamate-5-semialdehyde dehydrogenase [Frischella perrara]|uniref:Gamma-glutamyl phosphate reductase n=1 Tax=Frischella perrara TaxID=1267021 RepID=A0A0A7S0R2_FRIPE|nr:glutamate-5-semialdehyde dehydrogenase [Frischella perrara]AJA45165.1 glutamate-5-semialdehyde dehydrogenase [Frischella perrara]PWV66186.1 glutamate-5-semialdehyde dehydrogenase [Frischella perrara]